MRTALVAVAGLLWGVAVYVSDVAAGDQRVQVEPHASLFVDMYVRTRKCMRSAGQAAYARSNGDAAHTQYFMVTVCGSSLQSFMQRDMGEAQARGFMFRITRKTYYEDVLGLPEPPIDPKKLEN